MIKYYIDEQLPEDENRQMFEQSMIKKTISCVDEAFQKISKNMLNAIYADLEEYAYEHIENAKNAYCETLEAYLFGTSYVYLNPKVKDEIDDMLTGIGFTAKGFRKKLYEENKEEILKAFENEHIYSGLEKAFIKYGFQNYELARMKKTYPQTEIIKGFGRFLTSQPDIQDYFVGEITEKIKKAKEELDQLNNRIDEDKRILHEDDY